MLPSSGGEVTYLIWAENGEWMVFTVFTCPGTKSCQGEALSTPWQVQPGFCIKLQISCFQQRFDERGSGCVAKPTRRCPLLPSSKLAGGCCPNSLHPAEQVFFSAEQQLDGLPWLGGQLLLGRLSWGGCKGHQPFCSKLTLSVWFSLLFLLYSSILRFFTAQVSAFTWEKETVDVTCQWNVLEIILSLTVYFINKNDMKRSTRTNVFTRYKYNKIEE